MRMARAAAFFNMAAAAGRTGKAGTGLSKFLNAAAEGGISYTQAVPKIQQGIMGMQQKLAEDRFKLADASRKENADMMRDADREYGADMRNYSAMASDITKFKINEHMQNMHLQISERGLTQRANQQAALLSAQISKQNSADIRAGITSALKDSSTVLETLRRQMEGAQYATQEAYERAQKDFDTALTNNFVLSSVAAQMGGVDVSKLTAPKDNVSSAVAAELARRNKK
jgi:hypothetical protein